jgi:hypothetical protein
MYYIGDEGCENSVSLIKKMFDDIFKEGFSNYTFMFIIAENSILILLLILY